MLTYLNIAVIAGIFGIIGGFLLLYFVFKHKAVRDIFKQPIVYIGCILLVLSWIGSVIFQEARLPDMAMPMFSSSYAPGDLPPNLPWSHVLAFFEREHKFPRIEDISANPNSVPAAPKAPDSDGIVRYKLHVQEVIAEIAPGVYQNYWTFNHQVPGPMMRVKEGDTIELTIENDKENLHSHNIDLHAVSGPGGGSILTSVAPGETKTLHFKALHPGLFVYHCATPNIGVHNSHGQYGLILVDPKDPSLKLPKVDKEFYLMQGEFYVVGGTGRKGLAEFDTDSLLKGNPAYIVFNGRVDDSVPRLTAKVGDKIRIYIGNGGVNLISSFHVIGSCFDTVYPEAAIGKKSSIFQNVQTTAVLPGGASIVEFTPMVPGNYILVDHALARMNKGAWMILSVSGKPNPSIYSLATKPGKLSVPQPDATHSLHHH